MLDFYCPTETLWKGISDATGFRDDKDEHIVLNTGLYVYVILPFGVVLPVYPPEGG